MMAQEGWQEGTVTLAMVPRVSADLLQFAGGAARGGQEAAGLFPQSGPTASRGLFMTWKTKPTGAKIQRANNNVEGSLCLIKWG